jgi:hypothetical protein
LLMCLHTLKISLVKNCRAMLALISYVMDELMS